jgi:hypothetical protein
MGLDNYPLRELVIDTAGAGDHIIIPGIPGNTIRVFRIWLVIGMMDTLLTFKNGPAIEFDGPLDMLDHGTIVFDFTDEHWFMTDPGNDFIINLSSGASIGGRVHFTQSAPLYNP